MSALFQDRRAVLLLGLLAILALAPLTAGDYVLSILITVLLQAYLGMSWNVMMGFAGQFSLGHALYVGLGAYAGGALFVHYGTPPWIGAFAGMAVSAAVGAVIGTLGFRFKVMGVYFALLTIAFAEFTRVLFDHWGWVGASSGLFLPPAPNNSPNNLWLLRGSTTMFYYVILGMTAAAFWFCRTLLMRRIGYYWQAIREDQDAADALGIDVFKNKMIAVLISAAMTSLGGMFLAFFNNNLYPESIFSMHRSIELMLGTIIGGIGTLFGPILGAVVLTALGEGLTILGAHIGIDGVKQIAYGICLMLILVLKPGGLWPWLRKALRLEGDGR
ncbi:Branched-chain amino acid transport system permease protein LivM [Paramagnetospirillum magnetotacticum MS-1]|uniref:Branched-chain amino acid transport system permease protein LivM n=1 Tax=Paramagnetospirillum magnetotacticum MS-1 TaxID=272627 RepID=A0A0C2V0A2_PARME|nr:branched-chain amino acid ABC transporter permease [Paramagnetospirillum magnetotacticum]KIL98526.1 Branched-chain amino acid transport system permease protein LivM [Paramagnetospirillum magnetotacticum MS-1]